MSSIEAIAFYLTNRAEIDAYLATEALETATCKTDRLNLPSRHFSTKITCNSDKRYVVGKR